MKDPIERATVLLRAAHQLLQKCSEGPFVEDAMSMTVDYDDAECDGSCLKDDIGYWFEEELGEDISDE